MGILFDDLVIIRQSEKEEEPSVITVNCPDKTGLGCDLCRIILFFGLLIVRVDVSTDGKWCYLLFWVFGKPSTKWGLLKKRLVDACPSCSASAILLYCNELQPPKPPDVFLLKLCCFDRRGLLHDVTAVLCELELVIKKVKVSTTPDEKAMHLLFVTDTRELLNTKKRQRDTCDYLQEALGDDMINCDIEMVAPEITACSQGPSFLPHEITDDMFNMEMLDESPSGYAQENLSITMDNKLSPAHTLVQIVCQDHKGLLYDIMRTLKDFKIQVSYGRFKTKRKTECELDLFITQGDGKKIVDPSEQREFLSRLGMELCRPLRVALVSRGPDTELLVANPVELSGKGRPLVFHDITLALKMLNTGIFSADFWKHKIRDREWEVYRILLDEGDGFSVPRDQIEQAVWKMLMGWEQ